MQAFEKTNLLVELRDVSIRKLPFTVNTPPFQITERELSNESRETDLSAESCFETHPHSRSPPLDSFVIFIQVSCPPILLVVSKKSRSMVFRSRKTV